MQLTATHAEHWQLTAEQPKKPLPQPKAKREKIDKAFDKKVQALARMLRPATSHEKWFRHQHWKQKRAKVEDALKSIGTGPNQLDAFHQCGADCVVEWNAKTERYRLRGQYCHNRHCEPCQHAKANLLAANLRERLTKTANGRYRFVTLTLKHNEQPLTDQIKRLYKSFKQLRQQKLWKETQQGGAAILEVKYKHATRKWHPHLHIITEGGFLQQNELSAAWHEITGDSLIVDIRQLKETKDAAHYVAKYVSKGTNDDVWQELSAAQEWIIATKGVRSANTYGTWRKFKLLKKPTDTETWTKIGILDTIIQSANTGDPYSIRIVQTLLKQNQYNPHRARQRMNRPQPIVDT